MSINNREIFPRGIYRFQYPCENTSECYPIELHIHPGTYRFELWGAGMTSGGGYVSGEIHFFLVETLYCFIGGVAPSGALSGMGGFNGGGSSMNIGYTGGSGDGYRTRGGDGASDIRIVSDSLHSRLIVAGGAGGGNHKLRGGYGGGLIGGNGLTDAPDSYVIGEGGSQTEGGTGLYNGDFWIGSTCAATSSTDLSGCGGGGWFGGGSGYHNNLQASGGGGSSYISGYEGCEVHSSSIKFSNTLMINGSQYMPSPIGGIATGPFGSGFVRITCIDPFITNECKLYSNIFFMFFTNTFLKD